MKTFLGFTTGFFAGAIIATFGFAAVLVSSKDMRKYIDEVGMDLI